MKAKRTAPIVLSQTQGEIYYLAIENDIFSSNDVFFVLDGQERVKEISA